VLILGPIFAGLGASSALAIIFYSTGDPSYNVTPPSGELVDSGWQFQGQWGAFLGTAIAPQYFLTTKHVVGSEGQDFVFNGGCYRTTAVFDDSESDLRICRVCGTFPLFAPLFTNRNELNKRLVVFGRGTQRGEEVWGPSLAGSELKGWKWGPGDGVMRWGENQVDEIVDGDNVSPPLNPGGSKVGEMLKAAFNARAGPNEAHLSAGDSGGAVFISESTVWKLAGINYAVDGPYNTNNVGPGFNAALFDEGGLYEGGEGQWTLTPETPIDQPGAFYATRISSHIAWIESVLTKPIPIEDQADALLAADAVGGPYTGATNATYDPVAGAWRVPAAGPAQFFRLRARCCGLPVIQGVRLEGDTGVITVSRRF
jgi:hypothetical protein